MTFTYRLESNQFLGYARMNLMDSLDRLLFNPLKTKRRLLYLKSSPYSAVNAFYLGYKNQSVHVIWGRCRRLF
jgi:hypothetical protein